MVEAFDAAAELPVTHFGVVTSGCALSENGVERVCSAVREKKHPRVNWCGSLGCLDYDQLCALKASGLKRFHHNLESAQSFFPQICTTHSWEMRLETIRNARKAGLEVCCGGIFGLGESLEQRVEFALTLAREAIDSIPLNFLVPIPGTRLEKMEIMKPLDILRTVSMFRLTNPGAEVKVCAGRVHLGDLQSMIFHAGANSMMIGPLLNGCRRATWTRTFRCSATSRSNMHSEAWIDEEIAELREKSLERRLSVFREAGGKIKIDGRTFLNFSSNDYLGLARHPEVISASRRIPRIVWLRGDGFQTDNRHPGPTLMNWSG